MNTPHQLSHQALSMRSCTPEASACGCRQVLSTLPPSLQLELMAKLREQKTYRNREEFATRSGNPLGFSSFQMQQYLATSAVRQALPCHTSSCAPALLLLRCLFAVSHEMLHMWGQRRQTCARAIVLRFPGSASAISSAAAAATASVCQAIPLCFVACQVVRLCA